MKENFEHQKTFEKIRFNYMPKFSGKIKNVVIILYHHLLNVSKIRTYRIVPADADGQSDRQTIELPRETGYFDLKSSRQIWSTIAQGNIHHLR